MCFMSKSDVKQKNAGKELLTVTIAGAVGKSFVSVPVRTMKNLCHYLGAYQSSWLFHFKVA